jgi:hypothetical protein
MAQVIKDHNGKPVTHGRETVNGVRLHYYMAGSGEPLVLLHGVPKTSYTGAMYYLNYLHILRLLYLICAVLVIQLVRLEAMICQQWERTLRS